MWNSPATFSTISRRPPSRGGHVATGSAVGCVFFDFGKQSQALLIGNRETTSDLAFELWTPGGRNQDVVAPGVIQTNRWCHIAVVTGKGGVKIYFNG
ncbi:MAG: hypothetical protein EXS36_04550 [Pedosphaera sp.]|nr:hypothetical protein [Pedosphaera sp.]